MFFKLFLFFVFIVSHPVFSQSFQRIPAKGPEPGMMFMVPERIKLAEGGFFPAERGLMFVPLNRAKPETDVIAVEVYRFKRSDRADPKTPPIFYFTGGPGFSGMAGVLERSGSFESRWRPFLEMSDLVVVSQRGIGTSMPSTVIETTTPMQPLDQPYDDQKAGADYRRVLSAEKAQWQQLGVDLDGFTVIEAAADVEAVRQALGYDQVIVWGGSFGSHWGMTYMRYYPQSVARAILFGMEGPDQSYDRPSHVWNVFHRVAAEAEQAPELRKFIPEGGLIKVVERIVRRANAQPLKVKVGPQDVYFDGSTIVHQLSSLELESWPAMVIDLDRGDFLQLAEAMVRDRQDRAGRKRYGTASFWMLDCGSGISAKRLAEYEADPKRHLSGHTYWIYENGCPVWESDLGEAFRQNFETDIPTLIVQGTWDIYTPYENALELAPFFKRGKLLPVLGGPHGAVMAASRVSPEFKAGLWRFAETGAMDEIPDQVAMPKVNWVIPNISK